LLSVIKLALSLASIIVVLAIIFAVGYVIGTRRRSQRH